MRAVDPTNRAPSPPETYKLRGDIVGSCHYDGIAARRNQTTPAQCVEHPRVLHRAGCRLHASVVMYDSLACIKQHDKFMCLLSVLDL